MSNPQQAVQSQHVAHWCMAQYRKRKGGQMCVGCRMRVCCCGDYVCGCMVQVGQSFPCRIPPCRIHLFTFFWQAVTSFSDCPCEGVGASAFKYRFSLALGMHVPRVGVNERVCDDGLDMIAQSLVAGWPAHELAQLGGTRVAGTATSFGVYNDRQHKGLCICTGLACKRQESASC